MRVLGIHDGHNASACLLEDGRVVAAIQEERLSRIKNSSGFPSRSVKAVLNIGNCSIDEIDYVALNGHHMHYPKSREETMDQYRATSSLDQQARRVLRRTIVGKAFTQKRKKERLQAAAELGINKDKVVFVDHHLCHAAAAYFGMGEYDEEILILTNDGGGDGICATANIGKAGKLDRIAEVSWTESIGNIYAMVTFIMGMVPLEHEYKLMGLAPYASSQKSEPVYEMLRQLFEFDSSNPVIWHRRNGCPETFYSYKFLRDKLELVRFDWVCAGLQRFLEEMLTTWVTNAVSTTGIRKVALSGGVFMNVKANKAIMELPAVDEIFVYPSCGDETNALGAAYWVQAQECGYDTIAPLKGIYWGRDTDGQAVEEAVRGVRGHYFVETCDDIERRVAELLAQGEVVAWQQGRTEFGARALGSRSILANPSRPGCVRQINDMIKNRDFWMPFAPSILEERASQYLHNAKGVFSPYMTLGFDSTERRKDIAAATHPYDGTVRPQMVRREWNPSYHALISEFERLTGIASVLNTSFNLHGFPIVDSPQDGLEVLKASGLEYLALGNYLVSKVPTGHSR